MDTAFLDSNLFLYLVLPILIFLARICDVTIGTMRIIFVAKGHKNIAPLLGFVEVFIWIIVISQIISNLNNFICYFAYAAGFATGNYVGMRVEERLAVGNLMIRIITPNESDKLGKILNSEGFGYTKINAQGSSGDVDIIYSIVHRNDLHHVLEIVKSFNPNIFYSIEDVRSVSSGIFPSKVPLSGINVLQRWRKGK
ncbi:MAG: DUF2179 domain-containing protein [Tenuifilaceae bacterium]